MASMTMMVKIPPLFFQPKNCNHFTVKSLPVHLLGCHSATSISFLTARQTLYERSLTCNSPGSLSTFLKPIPAVNSGLEASISNPKDNAVTVRNAKILVESQDDDKMQVRVELTGEETQIVFDKVLTNLARTAPPVPGFRRQKGGKTSKVPKSFLLSIIGEDRVTKFVIQEIVSSTVADYVKKENLTVKDNKINTIQTAEELKLSFKRGSEFGFNATLELEKSETTDSSIPSESQA